MEPLPLLLAACGWSHQQQRKLAASELYNVGSPRANLSLEPLQEDITSICEGHACPRAAAHPTSPLLSLAWEHPLGQVRLPMRSPSVHCCLGSSRSHFLSEGLKGTPRSHQQEQLLISLAFILLPSCLGSGFTPGGA